MIKILFLMSIKVMIAYTSLKQILPLAHWPFTWSQFIKLIKKWLSTLKLKQIQPCLDQVQRVHNILCQLWFDPDFMINFGVHAPESGTSAVYSQSHKTWRALA